MIAPGPSLDGIVADERRVASSSARGLPAKKCHRASRVALSMNLWSGTPTLVGRTSKTSDHLCRLKSAFQFMAPMRVRTLEVEAPHEPPVRCPAFRLPPRTRHAKAWTPNE